jgi:hypothetical protein
LQHIFGVGRVACDSIGSAEHQAVVSLEHPLEIVWYRSNGFLPNRELQRAPPVRAYLRTGVSVHYYRRRIAALGFGVGDWGLVRNFNKLQSPETRIPNP